jgi:hypothetical protein
MHGKILKEYGLKDWARSVSGAQAKIDVRIA